MRLLGLDIGERRVGVAISDPAGRVATPLTVIDTKDLSGDAAPLCALVAEYEVGRLVVGIPLTLSGEEGPQAESTRRMAERLARATGLPMSFTDERFTTLQAERAMADAGAGARKRRGRVDMVAASLLLQAYIDRQQVEDEERR